MTNNDNEGNDLTFGEYQLLAKRTAIYPKDTAVFYPALGLAGEAGELCNKIKKILRDGHGPNYYDLAKEIGDVLWYVSALASDLDLDLDEIAQANLDKLMDRKERGVLGGSGDER